MIYFLLYLFYLSTLSPSSHNSANQGEALSNLDNCRLSFSEADAEMEIVVLTGLRGPLVSGKGGGKPGQKESWAGGQAPKDPE